MKRNKKVTLTLRKQTLRTLTAENLRRVAGGSFLGGDQGGTSTCDTYTCNGCYGSGGSGGGGDYNY